MSKQLTLKERIIRRAFDRLRGNNSKRARVLRATLIYNCKKDKE